MGTGATAITGPQVEGGRPDKLAVVEACLPASHASVLLLDLRVIDEIVGRARPQAAPQRGLAHGIAVYEARQAQFVVAALAAVLEVLVNPGHILVVVVLTAGHRQLPVTKGHRVMQRMALGAFVAGLATAQVMVETGIEQVVEAQRVVQRQRYGALVFAGCLATAVVHRQAQACREALAPCNDYIALAGLGLAAAGGGNADIGFCGGHTLEVLQRLLDITQVQQVAGLSRHGVPQVGPAACAFGETDITNTPRQQGQYQDAAAQVLCFGQYPGGDVTLLDNRILHALHREIDSARPQAAPQRGVTVGVGRRQGPLELLGGVADQANVVDPEARGFPGRQYSVRGGGRFQANIRLGFKLLTQCPFALLLAQQRIVGCGSKAALRCAQAAGQQEQAEGDGRHITSLWTDKYGSVYRAM